MSQTMQNLNDAFAGESQAYTKYRYFAKIAREEGNEEIAKHFEHTAEQELIHAWGHLELIIKKPTTAECLQMAIDGETYEFTTMYPEFKETAEFEGDLVFANEANMQIAESKQHAEEFKTLLTKAEKRFAALAKIEKRHASAFDRYMQKYKEAV